MEHRNCVICFTPAVETPYNVSLVKWDRMWTNFHGHFRSTILSNICLNKILMYDNVSFCKECFDSSLELSNIMEKIAKLIHEKSRLIDEALNGILQRRNDSRILLHPNGEVVTKKTESCDGSKDNVVVESNANNETINIEEDVNAQTTDSPEDVQTNQENPFVETQTVLLKENETDPRNVAVSRPSSIQVLALTPNILLSEVQVEINKSNETTHLLEKSGSNALEVLKLQSFTEDEKVKERKQAHNHTTGKPPKATYQKRTVRKNAAGRSTKKQEKKKDGIFKCQLCYTFLKSQKNLEIHITKAHNNGQKLAHSQKGRPSTNCRAASSQKSGKRRNEYKCFFCVKRLSNIEQRTAHHEQIHNVKGRSYECSVCAKTFGSKNTLLRHQLTHTGDRRSFQCSLCDKFGKAYYHTGFPATHQKLHIKQKV